MDLLSNLRYKKSVQQWQGLVLGEMLARVSIIMAGEDAYASGEKSVQPKSRPRYRAQKVIINGSDITIDAIIKNMNPFNYSNLIHN